jgi:hypothetical protein
MVMFLLIRGAVLLSARLVERRRQRRRDGERGDGPAGGRGDRGGDGAELVLAA